MKFSFHARTRERSAKPMHVHQRHDRFRTVPKLTLFVLAIHLLGTSSRAQSSNPPDIFVDNTCVMTLGYVACMNQGLPAVNAPSYWAAIAFSASSLKVGGAHGRESESDAHETALQNCRGNGGKDCRVVTGGANQCVAMAISYSDQAYGYDSGENRLVASSSAFARCRRAGGKNCAVIAAPCAGDEVRWSAPLPL